MAETKTKKTRISVKDFIAAVKHDTRRKDAETLLKVFAKATVWKARGRVGKATIRRDRSHSPAAREQAPRDKRG